MADIVELEVALKSAGAIANFERDIMASARKMESALKLTASISVDTSAIQRAQTEVKQLAAALQSLKTSVGGLQIPQMPVGGRSPAPSPPPAPSFSNPNNEFFRLQTAQLAAQQAVAQSSGAGFDIQKELAQMAEMNRYLREIQGIRLQPFSPQAKQELMELAKGLHSLNLQKIEADFERMGKAASSGINQAKNSFLGLDAIAQGVLQGVGQQALQTALSSIQSMVSATVGAIQQSIKAAADFEQITVSFDTIIGSARVAQKTLAELTEFAATTPFELPEVQSSAKQLLAFGFQAEELTSTLRTIGDVSAGVSAPLNEIAYIYGTLRSQGRAYQTDINQFTMRGIPIVAELAKQFKVTEGEIRRMTEAGKIGFPEVQKAFEALSGTGGKFANMTQRQSETLTGQISNLNDRLTEAGRGLGKALEDVSKGAIALIAASLQDAGSKITNLDDLTTASEELGASLGKNPQLVQAIGSAIASIADSGLGLLIDSFEYLTELIKNNPEQIARMADSFKATAEAIAGMARIFGGLVDMMLKIERTASSISNNSVVQAILKNPTANAAATLVPVLGPMRLANGLRDTLAGGGAAQNSLNTDTGIARTGLGGLTSSSIFDSFNPAAISEDQKRQTDQLNERIKQAQMKASDEAKALAEKIKKTTEAIADFYRSISRDTETLILETKESDLHVALTRATARIKQAAGGFDTFASQFADTMVDLLESLQEPLNIAIEAQKKVQAGQNAYEDRVRQAGELGSSLTGAMAGSGGGAVGGSTVPFRGIHVTSAVDASGEPGLDYVVDDGRRGAQFGAVAGGTVLETVTGKTELTDGSRGYGNQVIVRAIDEVTGEVVDMLYAHLDEVAVEVGQRVGVGTVLGTQGRTGSTTGAHVSLDFFGQDSNQTTPAALAMRDRIARQLAEGGGQLNARIQPPQSMSGTASVGSTNIGAGTYGGVALTEEQVRNAAIIAQVGQELGVSPRDIQVALAVALQESSLRNIPGGDRDSLGLFQQRPSMDWGTRDQIMDPVYSTRAFFQGAGTNPGLLDEPNRDSRSLTELAQSVQRSGFPDAYAAWEETSAELLNKLPAGMGAAGGAGAIASQQGVLSTATSQAGANRQQQQANIQAQSAADIDLARVDAANKLQRMQQQLEDRTRDLTNATEELRRETGALNGELGDDTAAKQHENQMRELSDRRAADLREQEEALRKSGREIETLTRLRDAAQNNPAFEAFLPQLEATLAAEIQHNEDLKKAIAERGPLYDRLAQQMEEAYQRQQQAATFAAESGTLALNNRLGGILAQQMATDGDPDGAQRLRTELQIKELINEAERQTLEIQEKIRTETNPGVLAQYNEQLEAVARIREESADLAREEEKRAIQQRRFNQVMETSRMRTGLASAQADNMEARGRGYSANRLRFQAQRQTIEDDAATRRSAIALNPSLTPNERAAQQSLLSEATSEQIDRLNFQFSELGQLLPTLQEGFSTILTTAITDFDNLGKVGLQVLDSLIAKLLEMGAMKLFEDLFGSLLGGSKKSSGGGDGAAGIIGDVLDSGIFNFARGSLPEAIAPSLPIFNLASGTVGSAMTTASSSGSIEEAFRKERQQSGHKAILAVINEEETVLNARQSERFHAMGLDRIVNMAAGSVGGSMGGPGGYGNQSVTYAPTYQLSGGGPDMEDAVKQAGAIAKATFEQEFSRRMRPNGELDRWSRGRRG